MRPSLSPYLDFDELERRYQASEPHGATGAVRMVIVRRGGVDAHDLPARVELSPDGAIAGDRWIDTVRDPEAQVSLIMRRVADVLVGGEPSRWHVPGDNLVVDLDLGVEALPVGARLAIGGALLEITGKPHAGCDKFRARVGDDAIRWVNAREHRARRLRGVFARVVAGGAIAVGDSIARVG